MPVFAYTALDGKGAKIKGSLAAGSEAEALSRLEAARIFALELLPAPERRAEAVRPRLFSRRRVSAGEVVLAIRRLATLISADIPIVESLRAIRKQLGSPELSRVLAAVEDDVQRGQSLSTALAKHPGVFPPLMLSMVRVGETGGFLPTVLEQLADFLERDRAVKSEVMGALAYPAVVLTVAAGTVAFLLTSIVPRLAGVFAGMGTSLPAPTRLMLTLSGVVQGRGWLLLGLGLGVVGAFVGAWRSRSGRIILERARLSLPLFGSLSRKTAIARFARCLAALCHGGVPLMEALDVVKEVLDNRLLTEAVARAQERVRKGEPMARGLAREALFPEMVTYMVAAGEDSGQLDAMLAKVADIFEMETRNAVRVLLSLLSPLLILAVAAVVGFIALAMLLPIFQMNQMLG